MKKIIIGCGLILATLLAINYGNAAWEQVVYTAKYLIVGAGTTELGLITGRGHTASQDILHLRGAASQSGDAIEYSNSSGTKVWAVASGGATTFAGGTSTGSLTFSGVTTDITTASNEDLTLVGNGTGVISLNDAVSVADDITLTAGGSIITTSNGSITLDPNGSGGIVAAAGLEFQAVTVDISSGSNEDVRIDANGTGTFICSDDMTLDGNLTLTSGGTITTSSSGNLILSANSSGTVRIDDTLTFVGSETIASTDGGSLTIDLNGSGRVNFLADLYSTSNDITCDDLTVGDDVGISGDLGVTGKSTLGGDIEMTSGGSITTTSSGNLNIDCNGTGKFTVADDFELTGDMTLISGGTITTSSSGNLILSANSSGTVRIDDTLTFVGSETIASTDGGSLTIDLDGSGRVNFLADLYSTSNDITCDDLTIGDDIDMSGDITMTGGGTITTSSSGNLILSANSSGTVRIDDTLTFVGSETIASTDGGSLTIDLNGSGRVNFLADLYSTSNDITCDDLTIGDDIDIGGDVTLAGNISATSGMTLSSTSNGDIAINPDGNGEVTMSKALVLSAAYISEPCGSLPANAIFWDTHRAQRVLCYCDAATTAREAADGDTCY